MGDVQPLNLEDDEDFFSDLGSDEPYIRDQAVGSGSRLVIDIESGDSTPRNGRTNPFSTSEVRARNVNQNQKTESGIVPAPGNHNEASRTQLGSKSTDDAHSSTSSTIFKDHCHIPHKHEEDNTVRNQLIAISIFTILFGIGETIGMYPPFYLTIIFLFGV